ncbi:bifunctional glycosyltransferase family 2 protein/CDP-glycerol:glycerophosphate glycerophosphotransferase [Mobilitalea sibirica]|uniref:Bifunctional glycosyltransferase family 2 protein/CDP-glycerol:glycerophosphate glycerophosphotransferase n=1 Tax=Mobilitalea sibirica TaxID=1462919 RepID=A0A8J7HBW0_9FIRM|nr:bifunctional glycosyltransferase family 2 protein/CDP-glycerol:glycerophosphate glycerophosphotransferase [Mobilitalea sibirica]
MKLSIIVPFHKGIHFLEDCFESIRDQGLTGYETVLVLDHVKEDLGELIRSYEDINIRTIELNEPVSHDRKFGNKAAEENLKGHSGVAASRNAGLLAAQGEYVYFLDSDDYIINGTLPMLLKEAQEQGADFTYGRKASTWFRRKVYLAALDEKNLEEAIEEEQDQTEQIEQQEASVQLEQLEEAVQLEETEIQVKLTKKQKRIFKIQQQFEDADIENILTMRKAEAYYNLFVSRKGLRNVSVLGVLFSRNFLNQHEIEFDESLIFFSDAPFMLKALDLAVVTSFVEEAIYIKRRHNDPIHYPSLSQLKASDRFEEYIRTYKNTKQSIENNHVLTKYLEDKFITYYTRTYAPRLRRSENEVWRKEHFTIMQECMKEVDPNIIASLKGYKKRIVRSLLKGDIKKTRMHVNIRLGLKKYKRIKKNKRVFSYYLYLKHFIKMPMKENWVICESFFGKSYSDSPKYIYEYLCKNYPGKYRFIWVVNKRTKIPYGPTKVKRFSIRYSYYMARCKYNIFNVRQPEWFKKRAGNVFLETWHGTPLKKLVFDQEEVMGASPLYKAQFYKQSRVWDYLVSANRFSSEVFKSAFLFDKEMLEYGYPRNDILHSPDKEELAAAIKKKLGIPEGKKTILYAPTWRDDEYYGRGEYKFALKLDLRLLKKELGDGYAVLLRTHYFIADALDVTGLEGFAYNVSKYDDISELYLISDMLITDYSSVFFDYANLKRPILFYTYDLDKYRDMLRGFYMNIETEVPGPLLYTSEEVVEAIRNIDDINEEYKLKYDEFYERFCSLEDGHAAENVAKKVFKL